MGAKNVKCHERDEFVVNLSSFLCMDIGHIVFEYSCCQTGCCAQHKRLCQMSPDGCLQIRLAGWSGDSVSHHPFCIQKTLEVWLPNIYCNRTTCAHLNKHVVLLKQGFEVENYLSEKYQKYQKGPYHANQFTCADSRTNQSHIANLSHVRVGNIEKDVKRLYDEIARDCT